MRDEQLEVVLEEVAAAVRAALSEDRAARPERWKDHGERPGQYRLDLIADEAALAVLRKAGLGILSEESGLEDPGNGLIVVVDPVDGSTNASRGIPWYATSLCVVDEDGPRVALVQNLATGECFRASRGRGATCDRRPISASQSRTLADALVVLNGYAPEYLHWRQYRSLGASALDLCGVADGRFDATIDCTDSALGPWDYMAAMLVLGEVGACIEDAQGRELVVLDHGARRTPVSAGTPELFAEVLGARRRQPPW